MGIGGRESESGGRAEAAAQESQSEEKPGGSLLQRALHRRVIQRKASRASAGPADVPSGAGSALDAGTRSRMEGTLGADLSSVRVHTGEESARAADDLGAQAFTVGKDVHFGRGEFTPGSREGDRLLAHELHHTVHGGGERVARKEKPDDAAAGPEVSQPGEAAEQEADQAGDKAADDLHGQDKAKKGQPDDAKDKKGQPDAAPVKQGTTGIIVGGTLAAKSKDGKDVELTPGVVVEVQEERGDKLMVKVYSGIDAEAEIPKANFQPQPGVALDEGKPRDDVYKEFQGELWGADGPKPEDATQGMIADCYFIAAMGSIAAANNEAIKSAFTPHEPNQKSYSVRLYKKKEDSEEFEAQTFVVDTMLPALNEKPAEGAAAGAPQFAYAGNDSKPKPLWPALLEKAFAMMSGGYAKIGEGGFAGDALEAITGKKSSYEDAGNKDTVIERFKKFKEQGKAVVCGTIGSMENKKEKAFKKDGDKYTAKLTTHEGLDCEVMKNTLKIEDTVGSRSYSDDGNGAVEGDGLDEGSVEYSSGQVDLEFEDDAEPKSANDLTAEYSFRGMISDEYKVYAWHMYEFVDVVGDKLIFKNPWGVKDPKPIPADQFVKLFEGSTEIDAGKPADKAAP